MPALACRGIGLLRGDEVVSFDLISAAAAVLADIPSNRISCSWCLTSPRPVTVVGLVDVELCTWMHWEQTAECEWGTKRGK